MSKSLEKMRIIAIPLTRPNSRILTNPGQALGRFTYYQFQIIAKKSKPPPTSPAEGFRGWPAQIRKQGLVNWTTWKAADIWAGFGKAKGGWKLKVYQGGEKMVDRMEFEELALKSIDPSLGPSLTHMKGSPVYDDKNKPAKIPLIFPPSILSPSTALSELRAYVGHRIPRHRKGFYLWMLASPLTAPFMIIPIVPNLPFFFCVWRAWSHYRAYKSSLYLQSLLEHKVLVPESSESLDGVYKRRQLKAPSDSMNSSSPAFSPLASSPSGKNASSSTAQSETSEPSPKEPQQTLLLSRDDVPPILSIFNFKPGSTAAVDLTRAVDQARLRLSSGRAPL